MCYTISIIVFVHSIRNCVQMADYLQQEADKEESDAVS